MEIPGQSLGPADPAKVGSGWGEAAETPVLPEASRNAILCETVVFRTWALALSTARSPAHFAFSRR